MDKRGYLMKRPLKGVASYKRRFFVLKERKFSWHKDEKDRSAKGYVLTGEIKTVYNVEGEECVFHIQTGKKTYIIQAYSHDEMLEWLQALKAAGAPVSQTASTAAAEQKRSVVARVPNPNQPGLRRTKSSDSLGNTPPAAAAAPGASASASSASSAASASKTSNSPQLSRAAPSLGVGKPSAALQKSVSSGSLPRSASASSTALFRAAGGDPPPPAFDDDADVGDATTATATTATDDGDARGDARGDERNSGPSTGATSATRTSLRHGTMAPESPRRNAELSAFRRSSTQGDLSLDALDVAALEAAAAEGERASATSGGGGGGGGGGAGWSSTPPASGADARRAKRRSGILSVPGAATAQSDVSNSELEDSLAAELKQHAEIEAKINALNEQLKVARQKAPPPSPADVLTPRKAGEMVISPMIAIKLQKQSVAEPALTLALDDVDAPSRRVTATPPAKLGDENVASFVLCGAAGEVYVHGHVVVPRNETCYCWPTGLPCFVDEEEKYTNPVDEMTVAVPPVPVDQPLHLVVFQHDHEAEVSKGTPKEIAMRVRAGQPLEVAGDPAFSLHWQYRALRLRMPDTAEMMAVAGENATLHGSLDAEGAPLSLSLGVTSDIVSCGDSVTVEWLQFHIDQ